MFNQLLERIARGLDERQIPYMVIGGQAVLIYGEPRLTRDFDITLGVGPERLTDVLTQGQTLDEVTRNLREAVELHLGRRRPHRGGTQNTASR